MTPSAATAIMAMGWALTRPMAEHHARLAAERGATEAEIKAAWDEWDEINTPQVIHSDPRPDTLCACADTAFWHEGNTGRCVVPGCGCRWMRPGGKRWTA